MRTIVLTLTAVLLVGCTPTQPTSSPSVSVGPVIPATPEYHCTPDGSQTAAPCTEAEYRAQLERDQQYAEAEAIYRKMNAAELSLYQVGAEADESVLQYLDGEAREIVVAGHAGGARIIQGLPKIESVARYHGDLKEGAQLALVACVDNTGVEFQAPDGGVAHGVVSHEWTYFANVAGSWKIILFESKEAASC